jgi:hypothetical protein
LGIVACRLDGRIAILLGEEVEGKTGEGTTAGTILRGRNGDGRGRAIVGHDDGGNHGDWWWMMGVLVVGFGIKGDDGSEPRMGK